MVLSPDLMSKVINFLILSRTKEEFIIAEFGQKGFEIKGGNKKVSCKKAATPILEKRKTVDFETLLENPTKTLRNLMDIQNENIDIHLQSLPLSNRVSHALFRSKIFMLSEILDCTYNDLEKIRNFGKNSINEVLETILNKYHDKKSDSSQFFNLESLSNGKYFELIIGELKFNERELYCLKKRYVEGETIEKLAKSLDLTRERVRQIVDKIDRVFVRKIKNAKFLELIKDTRNGNFIDGETLKSFLGAYADRYMHYFIHQKFENFYYLKDFDIFVFNSGKEIRKKFDELQKKLPMHFILDDYKEEFTQLFLNMGIYGYPEHLLINGTLKYLRYTKYGMYCTQEILTLYQAVDLLFKYYINAPIKYTEENFTHMQSILKTKLGYTVESNFESFEKVIRENEKIILAGKRTYLSKNQLSYNSEILGIAYQYLTQKKQEGETSVKAKEIFKASKENYQRNGIENEYVLYSIIKENYSNEFFVGKGNAKRVYFNETKKTDPYDTRILKIDFSDYKQYFFSKPIYFEMFSKKFYVNSWIELYLKFCNVLINHKPDTDFYLLKKLCSGDSTTTLFSKNQNRLINPKLLQNGIFAETQLSTNVILKTIKELLSKFSIVQDQIKICYVKKKEKEN